MAVQELCNQKTGSCERGPPVLQNGATAEDWERSAVWHRRVKSMCCNRHNTELQPARGFAKTGKSFSCNRRRRSIFLLEPPFSFAGTSKFFCCVGDSGSCNLRDGGSCGHGKSWDQLQEKLQATPKKLRPGNGSWGWPLCCNRRGRY